MGSSTGANSKTVLIPHSLFRHSTRTGSPSEPAPRSVGLLSNPSPTGPTGASSLLGSITTSGMIPSSICSVVGVGTTALRIYSSAVAPKDSLAITSTSAGVAPKAGPRLIMESLMVQHSMAA